jgi:adenylate cyclase
MAKKEEPVFPTPADQIRALTAAEIQRQLQWILASPEFNGTRRQREFLQFVVNEAIAGRAKEIKAFTVATRVFGRKEDFDQSMDPIVSIQANGLRRALERYYLVAGKEDPVRIDIPRGTYVPTFCVQTGVESDRAVLGSKVPDVGFEGSWPSVLIRPFKNLTGDREKDYLGTGLATELAVEIGRFQEIRVLLYSQEELGKASSNYGARFVIDGNVQEDRTGIKLTIHLVDTKTMKQIWGDSHWSDFKAAKLIAFEEEVAPVVAAKIAGARGIIAKALSYESKNQPPSEFKAYEAILRYYEYDETLTTESFVRALAALENAASIEPKCGQVWTMLGRLYANIYSLELPGFETALRKAVEFAERGVQLNPNDQRGRGVLALVRMFSNEIPGARAEVEKALALNPNSLFILDGIAYLMTLLGDWERGPALIRKVISLNPFYNSVVHYGLWLDWFRQEEYEKAHLETLNFRRPAVFWDPLAKGATFGKLGRYEEGKRAVENLLKLKPDFPSRGRILIRHYIKFEDIVEKVVDGLRKSGLNLEEV